MPVRLQKFLSQAGVASRRAEEELIRAGRVRVNGAVVTELDVPRAGLAGSTLQAGKRRFARLRETA